MDSAEDELPLLPSRKSTNHLRYFVLGACIGVSIGLVFLLAEGRGVPKLQREAVSLVSLISTRHLGREIKLLQENAKGMFTRPSLPWDITSLEPYISRTTIYNHYQLHAGYVTKLNAKMEEMGLEEQPLETIVQLSYGQRLIEAIGHALESALGDNFPLASAQAEIKSKEKKGKIAQKIKLKGQFSFETLGKLLEPSQLRGNWSDLFNYAAQNYNHQFYWKSLSPDPRDGFKHFENTSLEQQLIHDFHSMKGFVSQFKEKSAKAFGSGYCWLVLEPPSTETDQAVGSKLRIFLGHDADTPLVHGLIPLFTIDLWEHAYFLDYHIQRVEYVETVLTHLVNWTFVHSNFKHALRSFNTSDRMDSPQKSEFLGYLVQEEEEKTVDEDLKLEKQYIHTLYGLS